MRSRWRRWPCVLLLGLVPLGATRALDASSADTAADAARASDALAVATLQNPETAPLLLPVTVNGEAYGETALLRLADGSVLARRSDWVAWRLALPERPPLRIQNDDWWDLRLAPGMQIEADPAAGLVRLRFETQAFTASHIRSNPSRLIAAQPPDGWGGYLNYEFFASGENASAAASHQLSGELETVLFNPAGSLGSHWLAADLDRQRSEGFSGAPDGGRRRFLRLDSNWQQDDPEALTTLVLGDAIGSAGLFGRANRFGGVRWGRNFSTQPGLVTLPQPALSGESSLPSVVDVFVDGVRRDSQRIPAGPFAISDIPAVNGQGEVRVVVRDLLGREQVLLLPYIASLQQLKAGLHDYSVEAGWLRRDFGVLSNHYRGFAATTEHLYGLTDAVTVNSRLELRDGSGITAGGGGLVAVPKAGLFTAAAAFSQQAGEGGGLALFGWQRYFGYRFNLGLRAAFATRQFFQTGQLPGLLPPVAVLTASAGLPLGSRASLGVSWLAQRDRVTAANIAVPQRTEAVTASLNARVMSGSLSLQAFRRIEPADDLGLALVYTLPLGGNRAALAGVRQQVPELGQRSTQFSAGVQQGVPLGEGTGWRAQVLHDIGATRDTRAEAGVAVNTAYGAAALDVGAGNGTQSYRADLGGSLAAFDGHLLAGRRIFSSFALVDVGAPGIDVQLNNQLAGRSNRDSVLLLPELVAYQENQVRADASTLPLDVELRQDQSMIIPYYRSGLRVALAQPITRNAVALLLGPDGKALPALSEVALDGQPPSAVGREGKAYLTGLAVGRNRLQQRGGPCRWWVDYPETASLQPQLGPVRCELERP